MRNAFFSILLFCAIALSGAENLWPDPGFESWDNTRNLPSEKTEWVFREWALKHKAFAVFGRSTQNPHSGKYALHLLDSRQDKSFSGIGLRFRDPKLFAGKILDFSAFIRQIAADRENSCGIQAVLRTKEKTIYCDRFLPVTEKTKWEKLSIRTLVPENVTEISVYLYASRHYGTKAEVFFDDVSLRFLPPDAATEKTEEKILPGRKIMLGKTIRFPQDAPRFWNFDVWGGFVKNEKDPANFRIPKKTIPYSFIRFRAFRPQFVIGLSEFKPEEVRFSMLCSRSMPVFANFSGRGGKRIGSLPFRSGGKKEGKLFRYAGTFAEAGIKELQDLDEIFLHFPAPVEKGDLYLQCTLELPSGTLAGPSEAFQRFLAQSGNGKKVFDSDPFERPVLKNGTFYFHGSPHFCFGPMLCVLARDFDRGSNPLGITHRAYTTPPDTALFRDFGFTAFHLCDIPHDMHFSREFEKERSKSLAMAKRLSGIPCVLDMSIGTHPMLDPEKEKRLDQQNPDWHAYIPCCPEHPETKKYYERRCRTEADETLSSGFNPFLYELVNESSYNCFCSYNRRAFAGAMKKKYGSVAKLNAAWGTKLPNFEAIELLPVRDMLVSRNEWCEFASERYAEFLASLKENIRKTDKRKNVYFTEQLALHNVYSSRGSGMDYRRIADVLDVIAHEGGLRFGSSAIPATGNVMEDAACAANKAYLYVSDFFDAVASKRGKGVMNDEYYCARFDFGKRVPGRKNDMVSAMWSEIFHGSSGALLYLWDKRFWEYRDMASAKKCVINGGYKAYSYLNPFNWPPETLDFGRQFFEELSPYRAKLLPGPRRAKASVALFHSYPSMRLEAYGKYSFRQKMFLFHEALLGAQFPLEIVFEEELRKGFGKNIKALILPEATFASPEDAEAVRKFIGKGGIVIADKNALTRDLHGRKTKQIPGMILLDASSGDSAERLVKILEEKHIPRHGELSGNGKPLRGSDLQMIDRGDFKMIFLLNMSGIFHSRAHLKLFTEEEGPFYLCDAVRREIILPEKGERWTKAMLERGFPFLLPPQERVLFTLEKKRPENFTLFRLSGLSRRFAEAEKKDADLKRVMDSTRRAEEKKKREARNWEDVRHEKCFALDLSEVVSMAFADDIAGDGKGGWFDQGPKDFREMPTGKIMAANVPFTVIDPAENHGKSCVILCGKERMSFPVSAAKIRVGDKVKRLYFLHTAGWGDRPGTVVLEYRITYEDGSKAVIPVRYQLDIASWGDRVSVPNAKIGIEKSSGEYKHFQVFRWNNPHPEKKIVSLDAVSLKTGAVIAVAGITAEQ